MAKWQVSLCQVRVNFASIISSLNFFQRIEFIWQTLIEQSFKAPTIFSFIISIKCLPKYSFFSKIICIHPNFVIFKSLSHILWRTVKKILYVEIWNLSSLMQILLYPNISNLCLDKTKHKFKTKILF